VSHEQGDPFCPPHLTSASCPLQNSKNLWITALARATPSPYPLYTSSFGWPNPEPPSGYPFASSHALNMKNVQMKHNATKPISTMDIIDPLNKQSTPTNYSLCLEDVY
jgi:hypothetical protein